MSAPFRDALADVLRARFPLLVVETPEEQRVLGEIRAVATDAARVRTPRRIVTWSLTEGLVGDDGGPVADTTDPVRALDVALRAETPTVFVLRDLHPLLGDGQRPAEPRVVRRLRDVAAAFRSGPVARTLLLVSPVTRIPVELEKDVAILDFALPSAAEIRHLLTGLIDANTGSGRLRVDLDAACRERLVSAALGLTLHEAENAFARAMVTDRVLDARDVETVLEEKRRAVRVSGMLQYLRADVGPDDVGGLENLKSWLARREGAWLPEAADYGVPPPRGVLITGIPGCGKSLTAKATAAAWGLPLLQLEMGRVFAGLVGSSEQNMRRALRTAEAVAPCVLWLDEVEKGFAGAAGSGDAGTASRVFGSFLTWMQEKSAPVFVIATANDIERLPAEFLRKGRFDEVFFVDLPTPAERAGIWAVHLRRRLRAAPSAAGLTLEGALLDRLVQASEGYSGAEIEHAVVAGLFEAFAERRAVTGEDLLLALAATIPLSVTQAEQVRRTRAWADLRAVAATAAHDRFG